MAPVAGPFYFAWVDATDTTFNSEHYRMDEYVFSARRTLAEGQKPLLEIEIENPGVGLLSTGRKLWAWFSWDDGTSIVPLFFGRVVGAPVAINKETLVVQLIASPADYRQRVQLVAESLKVLPYWDPVFIDVGKRDDPDTILETRAAFWDVDPISLDVSAVSIVEGPDGNVNVIDHFYDSLDITVSQPPATAILMDASVSWTQAYRGVLPTPITEDVLSFGGDGLISEWPKPNQQLGGGYSVFDSAAIPGADANPQMVSFSWSYQNKEKHHEDGDTMSASWSVSYPAGSLNMGGVVISSSSTTGVVDPFAVDGDGDPSPVNIPASAQETKAWAVSGTVSVMLALKYVAARPRTERVKFLVRADMQEILVDPTIDQDTEVLSLSGADVGVPIVNLLNWTSIAGEFISLGTIIFPDNPDLPGSQTAQIAIVAGTAGDVEPEFSDTPGFTTIDNGVTWASLGQATPTDNARDWQADTNVPTGTVILPKRPDYLTMDQFMRPSLAKKPPDLDPSVSEGQIILFDNGHFMVCTLGGTLNGGATFYDLGTTLPSGDTYQVAIQGGHTGAQYHIPPFSSTLHATATDNGVIWACIGSGDIPIGGVPGMVPAASYFATDRGLLSIEYLGLRVRSRLLWRGRCADVSFDVGYAQGVDFTTRKMVTIADPRIPGGVAVGKMKTAVLTIDSGVASCHVTIGCTLGKDNEVVEVAGNPTYADNYVDPGYQVYDGVFLVLPNGSDLAFAPPVYVAEDDNITFPLDNSQVVVFAGVRGDLAMQTSAVEGALHSWSAAFNISAATDLATLEAMQTKTSDTGVQKAIQDHPVWYEVILKPLTGTFHKLYNVKFTHLTMGSGISLTATGIGPHNVAPNNVPSNETFYAPRVTGGNRVLQPNIVPAGDSFYAPALSGGSGAPSGPPTITSMKPASAVSTNFNVGTGGTTKSNHLVAIGHADNGAAISVFLDGSSTPAATTTADGSGNWSCDLGTVSDTSHSITAKQTSGGVTSSASSAYTFTVGAGIAGFTNVVSGTFSIDGYTHQAQIAGTVGSPAASYVLQNPDTHTLRLETRSGDNWSPSDAGHTVDRAELAGYTHHLNDRVYRTTFEFMLEAGSASSATGWCIFWQLHGEAAISPPLGFGLGGSGGEGTAGDKLYIQGRWWAGAGGSLSNANVTYVNHYVGSSNLTRGVWHTMEIEVYPDNAGGGHLYVWLDGVQIVNYSGNVGYGGSGANTYYYSCLDGFYRGNTPITETQAIKFRNVLIEQHTT